MKFCHPSERGFDFPRESFVETLRCHCLSSSKASTSSSPTTATDEAKINQASGKQAITATDQAIATNLTASRSSKSNIGGVQITDTSAPVSITTSDPEVIASALDVVKQIAAQSNAAVLDSAGGAVGAVSQLAATRLTGGETDRDKTVLYIGVAGFAALAYLATRK